MYLTVKQQVKHLSKKVNDYMNKAARTIINYCLAGLIIYGYVI